MWWNYRGVGINWKGSVSSGWFSIVYSDGIRYIDGSRCTSLNISSLSLTCCCIGCSIGGRFSQSDFALSEFLGVGICIGGVRGGGNLGIVFCLIYSGSVGYCDTLCWDTYRYYTPCCVILLFVVLVCRDIELWLWLDHVKETINTTLSEL